MSTIVINAMNHAAVIMRENGAGMRQHANVCVHGYVCLWKLIFMAALMWVCFINALSAQVTFHPSIGFKCCSFCYSINTSTYISALSTIWQQWFLIGELWFISSFNLPLSNPSSPPSLLTRLPPLATTITSPFSPLCF